MRDAPHWERIASLDLTAPDSLRTHLNLLLTPEPSPPGGEAAASGVPVGGHTSGGEAGGGDQFHGNRGDRGRSPARSPAHRVDTEKITETTLSWLLAKTPAYRSSALSHLTAWLDYCDQPFQARAETVYEWLNSLTSPTADPGTVPITHAASGHIFKTLSAWYRILRQEDLCEHDPTAFLQSPKPRRFFTSRPSSRTDPPFPSAPRGPVGGATSRERATPEFAKADIGVIRSAVLIDAAADLAEHSEEMSDSHLRREAAWRNAVLAASIFYLRLPFSRVIALTADDLIGIPDVRDLPGPAPQANPRPPGQCQAQQPELHLRVAGPGPVTGILTLPEPLAEPMCRYLTLRAARHGVAPRALTGPLVAQVPWHFTAADGTHLEEWGGGDTLYEGREPQDEQPLPDIPDRFSSMIRNLGAIYTWRQFHLNPYPHDLAHQAVPAPSVIDLRRDV